MPASLRISAIFATAWLLAVSAVAKADVTLADYLSLQRCLHCIDSNCREDGSPFPNSVNGTMGSGASRNVETYTDVGHKEVVAYPAITTRNEHTGQDIFTFDVDADIMIMGMSPAPRLHGTPGFWAFVRGTPYFCQTAQIKSIWNGHDSGSSFKFLLPPMTKVRGVRLRRYPRDGSLAEVSGMGDSEIEKWTPTLKCEPSLAPQEKILRDNAYYALADAIRFGVMNEALRTCKNSFPLIRNAFLTNLKAGCLQAKMPFEENLRKKIYEAQNYMNENEWSENCCARKFDDIFISRFGRGGLPSDYKTPACPKLDASSSDPTTAPTTSTPLKLQAH